MFLTVFMGLIVIVLYGFFYLVWRHTYTLYRGLDRLFLPVRIVWWRLRVTVWTVLRRIMRWFGVLVYWSGLPLLLYLIGQSSTSITDIPISQLTLGMIFGALVRIASCLCVVYLGLKRLASQSTYEPWGWIGLVPLLGILALYNQWNGNEIFAAAVVGVLGIGILYPDPDKSPIPPPLPAGERRPIWDR